LPWDAGNCGGIKKRKPARDIQAGFAHPEDTIPYGRLLGKFLVLMLSFGMVYAVIMEATTSTAIMISQIIGMYCFE
jgi:hypothetical protein